MVRMIELFFFLLFRLILSLVNLGDGIYYAQQKRDNIGDLIEGSFILKIAFFNF